MNKKYLYGAMGLLSLLGFIGIYTNEKKFLLFFAFAINFQYLFMKSDEMLEEYMNKSASRAFFCDMLTTAFVTLYGVVLQQNSGNEALVLGFSQGWAISIIVYTFSTSYYELKEKSAIKND